MREKISKTIVDKIYGEHLITRYFTMLCGVVLMALTFNILISPNNIVAGGVSGLSILLKTWIDPALFIFISSAILLLLSYFCLGPRTTARSVVGSLAFPLCVKLTQNIANYITFNTNDQLLIVIFAGVIYGFGAGLVFKAGFTTGGTDILNQIYSKYFKSSIGTAMIIVDGIIVVLGLFAFGWIKFMYAILMLYIISIMTDKVLLGISDKKAFYIVTEKRKEISDYVISELAHNVTIFEAKGGYSNKKRPVLFAVIPTKDYFKLKEGIHAIDKEAFFVVTDAYEVYGGE